MKIKSLLFLILGSCGLQAQQIEFFVTEFNQANYQSDASTLVGMSTRTDWDWPSFSFFAAIDTVEQTETITGAQLSGPSFPNDLGLPWNGESYDAFLSYDSLGEMSSAFQGGSHTFSGSGTAGLGTFNQPITLPAYNGLTTRLVTNFNELQAFDPNQPVTISWEPFLEGQGTLDDAVTPRGFIEVWVDYWDDALGSQYVWSHLELDNLNEFGGLPASQSSVTIPAGVLTGSSNGYSVDIYFLRIESYEDSQAVAGAEVLHLRSMDTILDIWPNPWVNFPQLADDWIDAGAWLGLLNVRHAPWIYSQNEQDYIYLPNAAVFAEGAWMWVPAPVAP